MWGFSVFCCNCIVNIVGFWTVGAQVCLFDVLFCLRGCSGHFCDTINIPNAFANQENKLNNNSRTLLPKFVSPHILIVSYLYRPVNNLLTTDVLSVTYSTFDDASVLFILILHRNQLNFSLCVICGHWEVHSLTNACLQKFSKYGFLCIEKRFLTIRSLAK